MLTPDRRIQCIEDRLEIAQLQAQYAIYIDDQNLDEIARLFASEGRFRSADGIMDAVGRDAICEQYRGRFSALSFGLHVTHDHIINLNEDNSVYATGIVSSHAEVVRNGEPMAVAMRYYDSYVREDGAWRFSDRLLKFFYYLPIKDYLQGLLSGQRMRAYGDERTADLPIF